MSGLTGATARVLHSPGLALDTRRVEGRSLPGAHTPLSRRYVLRLQAATWERTLILCRGIRYGLNGRTRARGRRLYALR